MRFTHPELLLLELLLPLLLLVYLRARRRGEAACLRYDRLLQGLRVSRSGWRSHAPLVLLLAGLGVLIAAIACPSMPLWLLSGQRTLVLAMDASGSMSARDVEPDRLTASKRSAKALVQALPPNVRVGVVSYADDARLVQTPTLQHESVLAAIDAIQADGGTAIGEGILVSLQAVLPPRHHAIEPAPAAAMHPAAASANAKPGWYRSAAIAVLTDGRNSAGRDPQEAAHLAALFGVKVYTVGFGTPGGVLRDGPDSISIPVGLDEPLLQAIAQTTGADYFCATSGQELARVFEGLQSRLGLQKMELEITALFALVAAILSAVGAGVSLARTGRIL